MKTNKHFERKKADSYHYRLFSQEGELTTINKLLVDTNKTLIRLRYEEDTKDVDVNNMLDILQHHIFLVQTCISKQEFQPADVKLNLLKKIGKET